MFFRNVCIVSMLCLILNFLGLCLILNFLGLCLILNFLDLCLILNFFLFEFLIFWGKKNQSLKKKKPIVTFLKTQL